jgi:branched-subunit amino acid aminotransferase/4-amino-4-deoxychorismate lyase
MRVDGLRVRGLSWHLERLVRDCRRLFDADLDPDRVRALVRHALAGVSQPIVVRVTVFDPGLQLGHPGADARPDVLVTTRAAVPAPPPLRLQSVVYRRELPAVKHTGLFGPMSRRRIAQRNGFDDALFTGADATISEAATANIGLIVGEEIIWPQADCLAGVTMRLIRDLHPRTSIAPVTLSQLIDMDAGFATNATVGIRPIMAIDGIQLPARHPRLTTLGKLYTEIIPEPL